VRLRPSLQEQPGNIHQDADTALSPELERDGWWHDLAQSEKLRPAKGRLANGLAG
jgi:hypothetical protein